MVKNNPAEGSVEKADFLLNASDVRHEMIWFSPTFKPATLINKERALLAVHRINDDKTEVILIGTKAQLKKVKIDNLAVGDSKIVPSTEAIR